jgi:prepilin-type N-terminal cleavage/methylation domain-containing protein
MPTQPQKGFTLIELSIVLIIIGLVVSGVLAGKSLIDAAKMRSQITQLEDYKKAYYTFKLKYDAVPGDMVDASSYWSSATDGDGDGKVTGSSDHPFQVANLESLLFFQHLNLSGIIQKKLVGSFALGYPALRIDDTKGMVAGGYIQPLFPGALQLTNTSMLLERTASLNIMAGNLSASDSAYNNVATLTILQAHTIDKKIDDGIANSGIFTSHKAFFAVDGDCLTGNDGNYLMTSPNSLSCHSIYVIEK